MGCFGEDGGGEKRDNWSSEFGAAGAGILSVGVYLGF